MNQQLGSINNEVLNRYRKICGDEIIDLIVKKAQALQNKHIVFISSTYEGGGVAEILNSLVFLFNRIGVDVGWRILHGTHDFFSVTKKIHNALQGDDIVFSHRKQKLYYETNQRFASYTHITHDLVVVHDPQPLPLITFYKKEQPWIFRCHIDLINPNKEVLTYLNSYIEHYDRAIISKDEYQQYLHIPCTVVYPAIDPLATKNHHVTDKVIDKYLAKYAIPNNKPIIAQISRFDKWKDPIGAIKIFESVRKIVNCTLVLLGSGATDDPDGENMFRKVLKRAEKSQYRDDIKVVLVNSDILVNCVQRAAKVIIQKSLREGFGLVVTEALFKGTPVVASNVGGIPMQVIDGFNGYLLGPNDYKGFANQIIRLLKDDALRLKLGKNGIAHVTKNFLITRLLLNWLDIFEQHLTTN